MNKFYIVVVLCKVGLVWVVSKFIVKFIGNLLRCYGREIIFIMIVKIYRECIL